MRIVQGDGGGQVLDHLVVRALSAHHQTLEEHGLAGAVDGPVGEQEGAYAFLLLQLVALPEVTRGNTNAVLAGAHIPMPIATFTGEREDHPAFGIRAAPVLFHQTRASAFAPVHHQQHLCAFQRTTCDPVQHQQLRGIFRPLPLHQGKARRSERHMHQRSLGGVQVLGGRDHQAIAAHGQAFEWQLDGMLVEVVMIWQFLLPLQDRFPGPQGLHAIRVQVVLPGVVRLRHDAPEHLLQVGVEEQCPKSLFRCNGLLRLQPQRRAGELAPQRFTVPGAERAGETRDALLAQRQGRILRMLVRVPGQPLVAPAFPGVEARHGMRHLAPAAVLGQAGPQRGQRVQVQAVLVRQHTVFTHEGQSLQLHVHERVGPGV